MSRRSSRIPAAAASSITAASTLAGLNLLINDNEATLCKMLSITSSTEPIGLSDKLISVMNVNNLSIEMLMARFFAQTQLQSVASKLGVSEKGSVSVLAARLAKRFQSIPLAEEVETEQPRSKKQKTGESEDKVESLPTEEVEKKRFEEKADEEKEGKNEEKITQ